MKIRHSSKSFRSKPSKGITTSSSDNLLFSPRELKQMHRSGIRTKILKVALPCLLVAVIVTAAYAMQGKAHHLPNNSLAYTSSISGQSSTPTSTDTSESTNPSSTNNQTNNDSNLQAQEKADEANAAQDMASVNAAEAQENAEQAQDNTENNTINAEAQAANQAAVKANAAREQCIAQAEGQYGTAMNQLDVQGGTRGLSAAGVANKEASLQAQLTSATNSCNNQ